MSKRKQILAIITTWYPPVNGSFIEDYARAFTDKYEVHVFVVYPSRKSKIKSNEEFKVKVNRIYFPHLPRRTSFILDAWVKSCIKKILSINDSFDVVHAHNFYGAFIAHELYKTKRIPYFITLHNTLHIDDRLTGIKSKLLRAALHDSRQVICVGKELKTRIDEDYNVESIIIPNFVDSCIFQLAEIKHVKPIRFVMIGFLDERKGIGIVLDAFKSIRNEANVELHLIGRLESKQLNEKDIAGIAGITCYGHINHDEIPSILNQCHVLISFSTVETFGITVIEAMSCGLPVLYCASGGPEYLVPEWAGHCIERSVNALAEGMREIVNRIDQFDNNSIRNYVIDNFDKSVVVKKHIKLYEYFLN